MARGPERNVHEDELSSLTMSGICSVAAAAAFLNAPGFFAACFCKFTTNLPAHVGAEDNVSLSFQGRYGGAKRERDFKINRD